MSVYALAKEGAIAFFQTKNDLSALLPSTLLLLRILSQLTVVLVSSEFERSAELLV